ncbi:MAG: hypothetical protein HY455_02320 [Parcubacteria group bacterium]|nr:hypothetical protein [Parcubacteria group bacterium]
MWGSNHLYKRPTKKTREKRKVRAKKKGEYRTPDRIKRHADRQSERGYANEERVARILAKAVELGRYASFRQTEHNGSEDTLGIDFVVTKEVSDASVGRGFGVTISHKSWIEARKIHPRVTTILVTPEMKDETLLSKVDALFTENGV